MSELKSRHAFGSEANIEAALAAGAIDAYDILFLNEGKIGWIDKDGKPIILEPKQQIIPVSSFPETGENGVVYIYDNRLYLWDGTQFISPIPNNDIHTNELINSAIEEFRDQNVMVVNFTDKGDGMLAADKTMAEILEAHANKRTVYAFYSNMLLPLDSVGNNRPAFNKVVTGWYSNGSLALSVHVGIAMYDDEHIYCHKRPLLDNPTKLSQLTNDSGFQTAQDVTDAIDARVPTDEEILAELIEADLLPTVTTNDKILTDKNNRIILRY